MQQFNPICFAAVIGKCHFFSHHLKNKHGHSMTWCNAFSSATLHTSAIESFPWKESHKSKQACWNAIIITKLACVLQYLDFFFFWKQKTMHGFRKIKNVAGALMTACDTWLYPLHIWPATKSEGATHTPPCQPDTQEPSCMLLKWRSIVIKSLSCLCHISACSPN